MSEPTEKLNDLLPLSPDHNAERLAELKRLFPDLFTNEGRLNVDELKKVVDPKLVSETERYDFRWYGKTASKREAFTPSRAALVYDKDRSVKPAKAGGNMIIEGENLEVLKLLSSAYRERIKCIYIDPPYNTGRDFVYSDRFAEGQKPYWEQTGVTEGGVKVDTNTESDGRFHSNWLSMMHARLLVARYLLRPDGVIFVSSDGKEVHNLRKLLDEVFGEENNVGTLIWRKKSGGGQADESFVTEHEYITVYSKSEFYRWIDEEIENDDGDFTKEDEDGKYKEVKLAKWGNTARKEDRPSMYFSVTSPNGTPIYPIAPDGGAGRWRVGRKRMETLISAGLVVFKTNRNGIIQPYEKIYFNADELKVLKERSILFELAETGDGSKELKNLFGVKDIFENPKPTALISWLLQYNTVASDIILDFFGGSGTTAQAVMELNKADGGNRQFILVQLPELTAADSPAHKADFKKISDITIERAKRVIARIQKEAEGLLPNDPQREFADGLGFKVFKLANSHFPRVEFAPDPDKTEAENIELLKQYIRDKEATFHIQWERETVLDEVLLKNGFMLDYTLTPRPEFTKNEVFLAKDAHKESLICLDAAIATETVDHFKKQPQGFFICLEMALDTTKKWNLKNHLGDKLKAF